MEATTLVPIVLAAAVLAFVAWPLLRRTPPPPAKTQQESFADALETEKSYLYASIVDLDADFKAGKLEASEYDRLREGLVKEASRILAQQDEMEPSKGSGHSKKKA